MLPPFQHRLAQKRDIDAHRQTMADVFTIISRSTGGTVHVPREEILELFRCVHLGQYGVCDLCFQLPVPEARGGLYNCGNPWGCIGHVHQHGVCISSKRLSLVCDRALQRSLIVGHTRLSWVMEISDPKEAEYVAQNVDTAMHNQVNSVMVANAARGLNVFGGRLTFPPPGRGGLLDVFPAGPHRGRQQRNQRGACRGRGGRYDEKNSGNGPLWAR
ncbi:hypothetical protein NA57DRAFT_58643 [Rhizodiscina lignyota]|uniref:Uncharacterized protein n=1 Tax=Rhizodiscina lignyota TaxID=1504668 RepID=A0A9P4IB20_9PEZI|nr:hypothetical protein NA57DRAFT_58643 [Rhizodiscina lignyota]